MRDALIADIPEIRDAARIAPDGRCLSARGKRPFTKAASRPSIRLFLTMFSFPIVRGDSGDGFGGPGSMVMTEIWPENISAPTIRSASR